MKNKHLFGMVCSTCLLLVTGMTPVLADDVNATIFWNDKAAWDATVPVYETLDFTGFNDAEWLSDQYADQGVTFSGTSQIVGPGGQFPNDGWGVWGIGGSWVHFDEPMNWIAVDHPGSVRFTLFLDEEQVYQSPIYGYGGISPSIGHFSGVMVDIDFDTAWIHRSGSSGPNSFYDDLHYGNWAMVPAPGAAGAFLLAAWAGTRRRRR